MPSNSEILTLAPIASYLAANDVRKSVLFNNFARLNKLLPQQIYAIYFLTKKIYDLDPNYSGMSAVCNYLWEICGRYGVAAQGISGGGSYIPTPTPIQQYPIYITQANFTTSTLYPNPKLFGINISVFLSQINRLLLPVSEFVVDSAGLTILISGFDALNNNYELLIDKYYN